MALLVSNLLSYQPVWPHVHDVRFDRDLSLAGRIMVKQSDGTFQQQLLKVDKPLLRIPTLAIHLDRTQNDAFKFNNEVQLQPICGLVAAQLNEPVGGKKEQSGTESFGLLSMADRHHPAILELIKSELSLTHVDQIHDFELLLYDTQPSCLGGLQDELVFSGRLDNLGCTFASVQGLIKSLEDGTSAQDVSIRLISCFDHEEIGSLSQQGADSDFLPSILQRLNEDSAPLYAQCCAKSMLVSADMAHAVNPNYAEKYEALHRPKLNQGVVIKVNANQRYTTNAPGVLLIDQIAKEVGAKLQLFVIRQDSPCGGVSSFSTVALYKHI